METKVILFQAYNHVPVSSQRVGEDPQNKTKSEKHSWRIWT